MKAKLSFLFCAGAVVASALPSVELLTMREAITHNNEWIHRSDAHAGSTAAGTGSMSPYIEGGEILLMERYDGQKIEPGMLVHAPRWDKPGGVLHMVEEVSEHGYVKTRGLNCMFSDGWYRAERTKFIVRRVIRVVPSHNNLNRGLLAASR